jgi:hypothetical protein
MIKSGHTVVTASIQCGICLEEKTLQHTEIGNSSVARAIKTGKSKMRLFDFRREQKTDKIFV